MRLNRFKEKLGTGAVTYGVLIHEPATQAAEVVGLLGFDFLFIDCEHSPMSEETAALLITACETRGLTPIVRVPQNFPGTILRYLDVGAMAIVIPDLNSAAAARAAVRAVKYGPQGARGLAPTRASDFGLTERLGDYVKKANDQTMVFGILESAEGVRSIEEILAVDGIDGVFMGTNDLSQSLGVPGQTNHPLVLEASEKILAAGRSTGKAIGNAVRAGETAKQYTDKGYRMLTTSVNGLIAAAGKQFLLAAKG